MMSGIRKRIGKLLAAIVIAGVGATWAVGQVRDERVALEDRHDVARMTEKMKTVCVGRVLIDMPQEAQIALDRARVHGFDIGVFDESTQEFQQRLAHREAQLNAKPDRLGGNRHLESAMEIKTGSGIAGKVFLHGRTVTETTAANGLKLERHQYEGVALEALVHSAVISIDLSADDYSPDQTNNLFKLVAQLVPNPDNKEPAEPGFCIDRAYFRDPLTADQHERIMMFAHLPSHPDMDIVLISGTEDNVLIPHLALKMNTGKSEPGPIPSSLSEDAAMTFWDKISSSIRLHSVRKPRPPAAT